MKSKEIEGAERLWVFVDDNGSGSGTLAECDEENNSAIKKPPFCE